MGKLWVAGNSHTRTAAWKRIFPPSLSSWLLFLYPLLWQRLLEHLQMQATVQQRAQLCPRAQGGVLPWRLLWVYRRPVPHRCDRPCTQAPWPQAVLIRELATCPGKHSRKLNEHDLGDIIKIQLNSYLRLTSLNIFSWGNSEGVFLPLGEKLATPSPPDLQTQPESQMDCPLFSWC